MYFNFKNKVEMISHLMDNTDNGADVFKHYFPDWDGVSKKRIQSPFNGKNDAFSISKGRDGETYIFVDWKMGGVFKGDCISFVMLYEGYTFKDAIKCIFENFIKE